MQNVVDLILEKQKQKSKFKTVKYKDVFFKWHKVFVVVNV